MMRNARGTGWQRESSEYTAGLRRLFHMATAVAAIIAMPWLSAAQEPPETPTVVFQELPLLVNLGDRVAVTDDTGQELQGELIDISPSALSVLVDDARHDLQEAEITRIRQRHPDSLTNGTLIGLLSGALFGGISFALSGSEVSGDPRIVLAAAGIYGGIGAGIGALVDYERVGSRVVYETERSSRRVSVAPLLARHSKGVAVSIGF